MANLHFALSTLVIAAASLLDQPVRAQTSNPAELQQALDASELSPEQKEMVKKMWAEQQRAAARRLRYTFVKEIQIPSNDEYFCFQDGNQVAEEAIDKNRPYATLRMYEWVLNEEGSGITSSTVVTRLKLLGMTGELKQNGFSLTDEGARVLGFETDLVPGKEVRVGKYINSQLGQVTLSIEGYGNNKAPITPTELQAVFKNVLIVE